MGVRSGTMYASCFLDNKLSGESAYTTTPGEDVRLILNRLRNGSGMVRMDVVLQREPIWMFNTVPFVSI
jgi:hypothetical protein